MAVQPFLPPEWTWVYDLAVGQEWPQADEDALRRIAQHWTNALQGLHGIATGGNSAAANVQCSVQSMSGESFQQYWSQYVDGDESTVGQMARQCADQAGQLLAFADQTEFTKLSIDIQLVILCIQLAVDAALAFLTAGASTVEGVAAAFLTRMTVRKFLFELLKAVLAAVLPDAITQIVMLADHHRASFDWAEFGQAAQAGVVGGLLGAGIGAGLGGSKFGQQLTTRLGAFWGGMATASLTGAATNVFTNEATSLLDSGEAALAGKQQFGYAQQKSGENPFIAALNGAFTGALFHSVHELGTYAGGGHFEPTIFTAPDGTVLNAVELRNGTGTDFAVFDESRKTLLGSAALDGTDLVVTPRDGTGSYVATPVPTVDPVHGTTTGPVVPGDTDSPPPLDPAPHAVPPVDQQQSTVVVDPLVDQQPGTNTSTNTAAPATQVLQPNVTQVLPAENVTQVLPHDNVTQVLPSDNAAQMLPAHEVSSQPPSVPPQTALVDQASTSVPLAAHLGIEPPVVVPENHATPPAPTSQQSDIAAAGVYFVEEPPQLLVAASPVDPRHFTTTWQDLFPGGTGRAQKGAQVRLNPVTGIPEYSRVIDGRSVIIVEGPLAKPGQHAVYALFDRNTGEFLKFGQTNNTVPGRYGKPSLTTPKASDWRLPHYPQELNTPAGLRQNFHNVELQGRQVVMKIIATDLTQQEANALEKDHGGLNELWGGPANVEITPFDQARRTQAHASVLDPSGNRMDFRTWLAEQQRAEQASGAVLKPYSKIQANLLDNAFPPGGVEPTLPGMDGGRQYWPPQGGPLFDAAGNPVVVNPATGQPYVAYIGADPRGSGTAEFQGKAILVSDSRGIHVVVQRPMEGLNPRDTRPLRMFDAPLDPTAPVTAPSHDAQLPGLDPRAVLEPASPAFKELWKGLWHATTDTSREHAVVQFADGTLGVVRGGMYGIEQAPRGEPQVVKVLMHVHPPWEFPNGISYWDARLLAGTSDQTHAYVIEPERHPGEYRVEPPPLMIAAPDMSDPGWQRLADARSMLGAAGIGEGEIARLLPAHISPNDPNAARIADAILSHPLGERSAAAVHDIMDFALHRAEERYLLPHIENDASGRPMAENTLTVVIDPQKFADAYRYAVQAAERQTLWFPAVEMRNQEVGPNGTFVVESAVPGTRPWVLTLGADHVEPSWTEPKLLTDLGPTSGSGFVEPVMFAGDAKIPTSLDSYLGQMDAVVIADPHAVPTDLSVVGRTLRLGGLLVLEGATHVTVPDGFEVVFDGPVAGHPPDDARIVLRKNEIPAPLPEANQSSRILRALSGGEQPSWEPYQAVTPAELERLWGITEHNQKLFQAFADRYGLVIEVRPSNPDSLDWLKVGGVPKPPDLKFKTITPVDVVLGAKDMVGAVGFFEPVSHEELLARLPHATPAELAAYEARRLSRQQEYDHYKYVIEQLVVERKFRVEEGVIYPFAPFSTQETAARIEEPIAAGQPIVDAQGRRLAAGIPGSRDLFGRLVPVVDRMPTVDPRLGPPVTGDHDMFNIRFPDGSRLSFEKPPPYNGEEPDVWFTKLVNEARMTQDQIRGKGPESGEMLWRRMGVQHGAVHYYTAKDEYERANIIDPILRQHGPGGIPLIRFQAGEPPRLVDSQTPILHASPVGDFRGDARVATADLTPGELGAQIYWNLRLIAPHDVRLVGDHFELTLPGQAPVEVRFAVGQTSNADVAEFHPRPDGSFDVVVSARAATDDVARAMAHELGEIRLRHDPQILPDPQSLDMPTRMTGHLGGRFQELRVLYGQQDRMVFDPGRADVAARLAKDLADPKARVGEAAQLAKDLADLKAAIGIRPGDPGADVRRDLLRQYDPALYRRLLLDESGALAHHPAFDANLTTAAYEAAKAQFIAEYRAALGSDPRVEQAAVAESMALDGRMREEALRRFFEPLFPDDPPFPAALKRAIPANLGPLDAIVNAAAMSPVDRGVALHDAIDQFDAALGHDPVLRAAVAELHQRVADLEPSYGRITGVLDSATGRVELKVAVPGHQVGDEIPLLELFSTLDAANQVGADHGLIVEYAAVLHSGDGGVQAVEVLTRPRPQYRQESVGLAQRPPITASGGSYIIDVGVGRSAFAVEMSPSSDTTGRRLILQTELADSVLAGQHKRSLGILDPAPLTGARSLLVFGDLLGNAAVLAGDDGIARMFINNVSADYSAAQYKQAAEQLSAAMAEGGTVEIQWDMSPENPASPNAAPGDRKHILGPVLRDAITNLGAWDVVAVPESFPPPGNTEYDFSVDAGTNNEINLAKLASFVPPRPQERMVIRFVQRRATASGTP